MQIKSTAGLSANLENSPALHTLFSWQLGWPVVFEKYADGHAPHALASVTSPAALPCLPGTQMFGQATVSSDCPAGSAGLPYLPKGQALHSLW